MKHQQDTRNVDGTEGGSTVHARRTGSAYQQRAADTTKMGTGVPDAPKRPEQQQQQKSEEEAASIEARKICSKRNHYEALGVSSVSTDIEIRAAYKKLALRFHPDRNKTPEAEEAFKVISAAYETLSDPKKRQIYDQIGSDDTQFTTDMSSQAATARQWNLFRTPMGNAGIYTRRFNEIGPEDLFNIFFGGMGFQVPTQQYYRNANRGGGGNRNDGGSDTNNRNGSTTNSNRRQQQQQNQQQRGQNHGNTILQFIHFLPLILLILLTIFSTDSSHSNANNFAYSMQKSPSYSYVRETNKYHVPYYVSSIYDQRRDGRYDKRIRSVEEEVEKEYISRLVMKCSRETRDRDKKVEGVAKRNGSDREMELAKNAPTPSCDKLYDMEL
uniref:DnaJ subfamily B member 12 n=1 Tax=Lygus hesperus TaxID=30085 RepID=A0A146M5S3_LYGHE